MANPTGFMEFPRELPERRPIAERINDWFEIYRDLPDEKLQQQGERCMDCGVPFCHTGCPLNNLIPDWNELVSEDRWEEAIRQLHATNNFPEVTGRVCPAPCESACVLGINQPPVTIKQIEKAISDRAFDEGWITPEPPAFETGKRVAIVGSGPAGLAAAQQLRRAGHSVTVYEKADRIGGLLIYGIPHFKMEKDLFERRLDQLRTEGVLFVTGVHVGGEGVDAISVEELRRNADAVLLACGAEQPRALRLPGSDLRGIHFAMDYLIQANRRRLGDQLDPDLDILANGKHVIIIGGGDTGADCLGTSHRQGAKSVRQFQIHAMPPETRAESTPWPLWPLQLRIEGAHEEGGIREWSVRTTGFSGDSEGNVRKLHGVRLGPGPDFTAIEGGEFTLDADLVLIAIGFAGPVHAGPIEQLSLVLDQRGIVATDDSYMTSADGVFAAGDMRRGQSLVVWAIAEGRKAAAAIDSYLAHTGAMERVAGMVAAM
ncbi:Glutamate synthase [NADPH] small chain [Acidisarcina polymorpha]|uniref:Glutamate synthase [NADPH] small chain n=1 Tax=Acidisarcina polymorpha TaxID=2211140 RepID=A0A2Z5G5W3_9BACT|nr:glutamate synthase subunit beta [Acidisarcina polymorpha]AXC14602.1 Glutamate synthase [NADPH] small chain [Acidisarcina polymorpha]